MKDDYLKNVRKKERKRNEAGTKTAFIEKERGRNEIVNREERPMPCVLDTRGTASI